jgi:CBS domain-containing protein
MNVFEVMTRRVFSVHHGETLANAAAVMWDRDVGCVPVLDDDGCLVGMLTDRDICMAALTRGARLDEIEVASVMSRRVHTCAPEQTLAEAGEVMRLDRIRRAPVVDGDGRLIGLLSLGDLAREAVHERRRRHGEPMDAGVTTTLAAVSEPRVVHHLPLAA